jgi:deglycase
MFARGHTGNAEETEIERQEDDMANELTGKRIAFLATDGVEQVELEEPWRAVEQSGARPELISLRSGEIQGFEHLDKGELFHVDHTVGETDSSEYDGLVLPGGVANPDRLRMDQDAVDFVRSFVEDGKPIGVICHGPWTLVEADAVRGRTLTSFPSLRTDIENAGGTWVDEEVHVDDGIVSSRKPADLPAFCSKLVEELREGVHTRAEARS